MAVRKMFRVVAAAAALGAGLALFACQQVVPNTAASDTSDLPPGFKDGTIGLPEGQLHYVAGGQGPALILLHGFSKDWSEWQRLAPLLAGRFTVIMPDLRGSTGTSERFDPQSMATDIALLMANRGINDAYLVGHDIGGPVAYALARAQPRRVRGVMLIESPRQGMASSVGIKRSPEVWQVSLRQTTDLPIGTPITVVGAQVDGMVQDLRDGGAIHVDGVVVPNAGHSMPDKQPEALAGLIAARAGGR